MLLEESPHRIEGDQGAVLFEVYSTVVMLLEETGHSREQADQLALTLLPRLQSRLASAGLVVRQIGDEGRHADRATS
jgi:hypothetical protein